ncbi:MAG: hypothetical protein H6R38_285 [Deltaproteobacteria bacterium]|nr:hypothetical protein [Deltaproteobacteria bacterium]
MQVLYRRRAHFVAVCALGWFQVFAWAAADSPLAAGPGSYGQSVYVPVYSHILFGDRAATFDLAATLSIRNTDPVHSISVTAADYHDAGGRLVKKYIEKPAVLRPLASTEVFVPESDTSGGFGASFIVRWKSENPVVPPVIECLMIGVRSGQGISIVSPGRVISENAK